MGNIINTIAVKTKCLGILLCLSFGLYAQENEDIIPSALHETLESVSKNMPSGSVYMQTNKGIYETAEDLCFKYPIFNSI